MSHEPLAAYVPAENGRSPGQQWKARAAVALLLVAGLVGVEAFLASQSSVALTGSRSCTNSACTTPAPAHSASGAGGAQSTTGAAAGSTGASSWSITSQSTGATTPGSGGGSNQSASADPGSSHGSLALTGIQVAILVIVALALLTAGSVLLVSSRRRRRQA